MAERKIDLSALPSNNSDGSDNAPPLRPVASGRIKPRQKSFSSELRKIINDLFQTIIVPSTKGMLYEFLNGGLQRTILGKSGPLDIDRGLPSYNAYHRLYSPTTTRATFSRRPIQRGIPTMSVVHEDIFFDFEEEAELVLAKMLERLAMFGRVSVLDMRNLCGRKGDPVHHRWGWTDLRGVDIIGTTEGWVIALPDPTYI